METDVWVWVWEVLVIAISNPHYSSSFSVWGAYCLLSMFGVCVLYLSRSCW